MNGLTSHEWVRATIIADVFHWGMVGVLALIAFLVQRWWQARQRRRINLREQWPGQFGPIVVPGPNDLDLPAISTVNTPEPSCECSVCGRMHWPAPLKFKEPPR